MTVLCMATSRLRQIKTLTFTLGLWLLVSRCALTTEQANDTIVIGGNSYGIFQVPMNAYWHLDGEPPEGRVPLPEFELTSTANLRGYIAQWSISREKLHLLALEGQIGGKKVRDRQIIKKRFPLHARWFTGKIYVSVGGFDNDKKTCEYVLEFNIKDGSVVATYYHESLKVPMTWDGLPHDRQQHQTGNEQSRPKGPSAEPGSRDKSRSPPP